MENYRKKLRIQIWLNAAGALALIAVQVLAYTGVIRPLEGGGRFGAFWNGFIAGSSAGVTVMFLVGIIINIRALRNEERLRKLYIREHDERKLAVARSARSTGADIFMLAMIPALIIAGYFSVTAFFTALACLMALCLTVIACKIYYTKKL